MGLQPRQVFYEKKPFFAAQSIVRVYRRRLPHWDTPAAPAFITWRLDGSLPKERVFHREHFNSGKVFVAWDRLLDAGATGPLYLRQPEIAKIVIDRLRSAGDSIRPPARAYAPSERLDLIRRMVRNEAEFERTRWYIEWNPVSGGLVNTPEEFPWSTAGAGLKPRAG